MKNKNGEDLPHTETTETVLVHFNTVNKSYQQNSRVLHTYVRNESFAQLLDISQKKVLFLKTFDSEFLYIEVWSNYKPLEIEDKISITLVIT